MKKILQALDGASSKPVEGTSDMTKFLRVVSEADLNGDVSTKEVSEENGQQGVDPDFLNWEDKPYSVKYDGPGLNSKDPNVKTWDFGKMDPETRRQYQIADWQKRNPGAPLPVELGGPGMPNSESVELESIKKLSGGLKEGANPHKVN